MPDADTHSEVAYWQRRQRLKSIGSSCSTTSSSSSRHGRSVRRLRDREVGLFVGDRNQVILDLNSEDEDGGIAGIAGDS
ncbi:hypothetical protein CSH63_24050 [Micromonospora tulbaghiae]|uniref:Uncharacterized protein n=1 Tax=Micromonospora tulbaghiae TaxID=479978 RepID=A0A386WPY9_9ACTN|nr:hypothetical protein CSH63_24050 [Micromonospora tulbaghiae]